MLHLHFGTPSLQYAIQAQNRYHHYFLFFKASLSGGVLYYTSRLLHFAWFVLGFSNESCRWLTSYTCITSALLSRGLLIDSKYLHCALEKGSSRLLTANIANISKGCPKKPPNLLKIWDSFRTRRVCPRQTSFSQFVVGTGCLQKNVPLLWTKCPTFWVPKSGTFFETPCIK